MEEEGVGEEGVGEEETDTRLASLLMSNLT